MTLSNQLLDDKFQALPETIFELPRVKKVLNRILDNENGECFYQGIFYI